MFINKNDDINWNGVILTTIQKKENQRLSRYCKTGTWSYCLCRATSKV